PSCSGSSAGQDGSFSSGLGAPPAPPSVQVAPPEPEFSLPLSPPLPPDTVPPPLGTEGFPPLAFDGTPPDAPPLGTPPVALGPSSPPEDAPSHAIPNRSANTRMNEWLFMNRFLLRGSHRLWSTLTDSLSERLACNRGGSQVRLQGREKQAHMPPGRDECVWVRPL